MTGRFFAKYLENVRKTHIIETEHLIGQSGRWPAHDGQAPDEVCEKREG